MIGLSTLFDEADKDEREAGLLLQQVTAAAPEIGDTAALNGRVARSREIIQREDAQNLLNLDQLDQWVAEWQRNLDDIDKQSKDLGTRISAIQDARAGLLATRLKWQKTLESYQAAGYTGAPLDRVRAVLAALDKGRAGLDSNISPLLKAQEILSRERTVVQAHLDFMNQTRLAIAGSRWQKESPSIFESRFYNQLAQVSGAALLGKWGGYVGEAREYFITVSVRIFIEAAVLLAAWLWLRIMLIKMRRKLEDTPETGPELLPPFEHPFSIALLLISLPLPLLHPNAPLLAKDLFTLMLVFPVLILLTHLISEQRLRRFIVGMGGVSVIGLTQGVVTGFAPLDRVVFMGQAAFGIGVVLVSLTPYRLIGRDNGNSKLKRWLRAAELLLLVLLGLVLLGQALGYNRASLYLGQGTFRTVYITLFIAATYRLFRSLFVIVIFTRRLAALKSLKDHSAKIIGAWERLISLLSLAVWVYMLALIWGLDRPLLAYALKAWGLGFTLGPNRLTLGMAVGSALAIYLSIKASRLLTFFLDTEVYPRSAMEPGFKEAINQGLRYSLVFIGFVAALSILGVKLSSLALVAGALGVGIGFGLQNIVNNFLSGLIMLVERPIKIGDVLEIEGVWGTVKHIGIRATLIETWDQSELIVPNGDLLWSKLTNWTHTTGLNRVVITVGVSYGSDPETVLTILEQTARAHPEVLTFPKPAALFTGYGESSLDFELRAYLPSIDLRLRVASEIRVAIFKAFKEAGIEIPFPQRDVWIRKIEAKAPDAPPGSGSGMKREKNT
ncbi:MAG TPA: mechanosensitive ion channel domain-containing protein [bacterium]|nr:mechanosensitive ion channel domain-containing protein [bacterium]